MKNHRNTNVAAAKIVMIFSIQDLRYLLLIITINMSAQCEKIFNRRLLSDLPKVISRVSFYIIFRTVLGYNGTQY